MSLRNPLFISKILILNGIIFYDIRFKNLTNKTCFINDQFMILSELPLQFENINNALSSTRSVISWVLQEYFELVSW